MSAGLALAATLLAAPAHAEASPAGSSTTITGTLVRAYAEQPDVSTDHRLLTWVQTPTDDIRVPTGDGDVVALATGTKVKVTLGAKVSDVTSREGGQSARDVLGAKVLAAAQASATTTGSTGMSGMGSGAATSTALLPTTPVEHDVTVVMVVPAGGTQDSTTLAQVVSEVNGPVHDYWSDSSGGRVQLKVTKSVGWTTVAAGCSDPTSIWDQAASAAGWTPGADKHLVVYLSSTPSTLSGCSDGLAEVGSGVDAGGRLYVRSTEPDVMAHEIGHNLGLMHAAEEQCDGVVEGSTSQCRETPYRDLYDVMAASWGPLGALSGFQSTQLGFMDPQQRRDVTTTGGSGVVDLSPVGVSSGVRAIRLKEASGATYWIEDREAVGRDAYLTTSANWAGLASGVVVRREGNTSAGEDATELLDASPSARAAWDSDVNVVVPVGATIPLGTGGWNLTVRSDTVAGAVVDVRQGTAASVSLNQTRYAGNDRYSTAAAVAKATYPTGASTVVVASGGNFPDGLAAGPAAAAAKGPLLLVPTDGALPDAVATELRALAPTSITVVGGQASVSAAMVTQLAALAPVTRVSGIDRYATAAAVAVSGAAPQTGGTVYLASGTAFPDALAGGAAAARSGAHLLLVPPTGLGTATANALITLAPAHVVALGGTTVVPDATLAAAGALVPGADTARWSGADRFATARAIASHVGATNAAGVVLASGLTFPDALAAAPLAANSGQPLLLTESTCAPADTIAAIKVYGATATTVVGGTASVDDAAAALNACP